MKKVLFLLILIPLLNFGQTETNVSVQNNTTVKSGGGYYGSIMDKANTDREKEGTFYIGNGVYRIIEVGKSSGVSNKKVKAKAYELVEEFVSKRNFKYEVINERVQERALNTTLGICEITFQVYNQDGTIPLNEKDRELKKENAKKKLLDLKKLKDEGIITQEEYDKAAAPHKKILLGL